MKTKILLLKPILVISIALLFCNADCRKNRGDCHTLYLVENQTNKALYFIYAYDSSLSKLDYNPGLSPAKYKCEANSEKSDFSIEGSCFGPDGVIHPYMHIFIFDAGVIETTSWTTIKQNRLMLKRFDLTNTQLDSCNWIITYP